jgi:glycosyltransferase involved in cell wall biosynthesis
MKIAVVFDSYSTGGGGFFISLNSALLLNKMKSEKLDFHFISIFEDTHKILEENNLKILKFSYNKVRLSRLHFRLSGFPIINLIFEKFKIKNYFFKFLKKNNFSLVIFLSPSFLINLCDEIDFIVNIFDINHKLDNFFPEYKSQNLFKDKELIFKKSVDRAFKILFDTCRSKKELTEYYNCRPSKIVIQPTIPILPKKYKDIKEKINIELIYEKLGLKKNDKFIFYPAHFWAHKNHKYIIDAIEILKFKKKIDLKVVFSGSAKENLDYIKNQVNKKKLSDNFYFFEFLTGEKVITLYKKTIALVMPTYVARSTLPLYEAFFFKVPVFYSKNVLDKELEEYVEVFDLNNAQNLADKLDNFINNKLIFEDKIQKAAEYFNTNCNDEKFINNFKNILSEFEYLKSRWNE